MARLRNEKHFLQHRGHRIHSLVSRLFANQVNDLVLVAHEETNANPDACIAVFRAFTLTEYVLDLVLHDTNM